MPGTEIRPSEPSSPAIREKTLPTESTPPVIEVDPRLLTEYPPAQQNQLLRQGLEILSGLARLALVWVGSREDRLATTTTNQVAATRDSALAPNAQSTTTINSFRDTGTVGRGRQGGRGGRRRRGRR